MLMPTLEIVAAVWPGGLGDEVLFVQVVRLEPS